jgi:hypothetical protein
VTLRDLDTGDQAEVPIVASSLPELVQRLKALGA